MIKIDKAYVSTNSNYEWLADKMSDDFEIVVDDKSKIVFGFNGIGKTSFIRCLREDKDLKIRVLDYETPIVVSNGTTITIAPDIKKIEEAKRMILESLKQIEWQSLVRANGFKKTKSSSDADYIVGYKKTLKTGNIIPELKTSRKDYDNFVKKYGSVNPSVLFALSKKFDSVTSSIDELDNYNNQKYIEFLQSAKQFVKDDNKCPVCETEVKDIDDKIDSLISSISAKKSDLVQELEKQSVDHDTKTIDTYLALGKELKDNPDLLNDYVVCGNNISTYDFVANKIKEIDSNEAILSSLNAERDKKYNEIKAKEHLFKKDVSRYLKVSESSVVFDDTNKMVLITLDRDASKYSTGERHILWFLVELYSFLGSDSRTLILDDPASSLDLINIYKIAFEIVRNASIDGKNIVAFTHSAELVNIINSQRKGLLDIYYIEELDGLLYSELVNYAVSDEANVFTVKRLMGWCNPKIIESLKRKDDENDDDESKVFHYDVNEHGSNVDASLSNYSLISLIDSFTSFMKKSFYQDVFTKIYYLAALRVWLEKKLYDLIPTTDFSRQNQFLNKDTIQEKVKVLENSPSYLSINREELLSKKVMLNQSAHYYSQVMPFAYAMNISFDDLKREIEELKELFSL